MSIFSTVGEENPKQGQKYLKRIRCGDDFPLIGATTSAIRSFCGFHGCPCFVHQRITSAYGVVIVCQSSTALGDHSNVLQQPWKWLAVAPWYQAVPLADHRSVSVKQVPGPCAFLVPHLVPLPSSKAGKLSEGTSCKIATPWSVEDILLPRVSDTSVMG